MKKNPLVSIVTPMFNAAAYIGQAIRSVQAQDVDDWELIVVDDCSTDGGRGVAVVDGLSATDPRVRLIALRDNRGSSGARNAGIAAAKGDFVAFLDADDLWDSDFLSQQLAFMGANKAAVAFSSYRRIADASGEEVLRPFIVPERVDYKGILRTLPICPSTAVIDIREIGKPYFDEEMGSLRDDYVFWLRLLKHRVAYAFGNRQVLASYRIRKDAVTSDKLNVILPHWRVLREVEGLSLARSLFYFSWWAVTSLWKYDALSLSRRSR